MVYTNTMSKFIYMAGLMDGEGTIGIARDTSWKFRSPYVSLTSTTPELVQWCKDNFGGCISSQRVRQENWKPSWSWRLRNKQQVIDLVTGIEPHMLEPAKKARIKLLLEEYPLVTPRNGKYSDEMLAAKIDFETRFMATK
jgi:hypothetical protein